MAVANIHFNSAMPHAKCKNTPFYFTSRVLSPPLFQPINCVDTGRVKSLQTTARKHCFFDIRLLHTTQSQPSYIQTCQRTPCPTCVDLQHQGPGWSAIVQRTKSKPGCSTAQPLLHGPPIGAMDETFDGIYQVASMCTPSNMRFVWAPKCYLDRFNCFWTAHPWPP